MTTLEELAVKITADMEGLKQGIEKSKTELNGFKGSVENLKNNVETALAAISFSAVANAAKQFANECIDAFSEAEIAATKLTTVMRKRMNATEADINSIKKLAEEQQKLGVIEDDAIIAGSQQLSTFLNTKDALQELIPAMANLAAQQKGVGATSGDLVSIGNLLGKAMQGQVTALTRVGITMSEAEKKMLSMGTEEEKAAALAQIITNNVGNMNAALANTKAGAIQQATNAFNDFKETVGEVLSNSILPFIQASTSLIQALGGSEFAVKLLVSAAEALIFTFGYLTFEKTIASLKNLAQAFLATEMSMKSFMLVAAAVLYSWNSWTSSWDDTTWADKAIAAITGLATAWGVYSILASMGVSATMGAAAAIAAGALVSGAVISILGKYGVSQTGTVDAATVQATEEYSTKDKRTDRAYREERAQKSGVYGISMPGYASGGFPEVGQAFIAREGGAAELVGNIGSNTAVVNNDQIVASVSKGVASAVASVIGKRENTPFVIKLDGDTIYKNQQRVKARRGLSFDGMGAFAR